MDKSRPVRILYMEDDFGLARLVQKRMKRAGYSVDIAGDGDFHAIDGAPHSDLNETCQSDIVFHIENANRSGFIHYISLLSITPSSDFLRTIFSS